MNPTIVIPGIKGTEIVNTYPIGHDEVWGIPDLIHEDPRQLYLDATGTIEADPECIGREGRLFKLVYGELVKELRGRLAAKVYLFAYDWRFSVVKSATGLVNLVKRLLAKPGLEGASFNFVCHSMGGLVFRAFLKLWPDAPVDRVVFIATPHLGSLDAAAALVTGEANLLYGAKKMRKAARTFPSVYELLPRYDDALVNCPKPGGIWNIENWQANTIKTSTDSLSKTHLVAAAGLDGRLASVKDVADALPGRVLTIFGAGEETLEAVPIVQGGQTTNWFDFDSATDGDGDSVVLVESAKPSDPNVQIPSVQIETDEIRLSGISDRLLAELSLHAFLPVIDEVQTVVGRFLEGQAGKKLLPVNMDPAKSYSDQ